ncbi:MAG: hypothetical protein H6729_16870 [Deltaproteobacteria bacterium]|nr:hypothetical protein [Deltaproteobacteria bacterium]
MGYASSRAALGAGFMWTVSSPGPAILIAVVQTTVFLPWAFGAAWLTDDFLARSIEADRFLRSIDVVLLADLIKTQALGFHAWLVTLAAGALVFIGTSTFLTGGLIATAMAPRPSVRFFFTEAGRAWPRLLWLLGVTVPLFGAAVVLPAVVVFGAADAWAMDCCSEGASIAIRVCAALLIMIDAALILAAIDAMKIQCVRAPEDSLLRIVRAALRAVWISPLRALALYLPYPCVLFGAVLVWAWVDVRIPRSGWMLCLIGFAWQQIGAVLRSALRSAWIAAEVFYWGPRLVGPGRTSEG